MSKPFLENFHNDEMFLCNTVANRMTKQSYVLQVYNSLMSCYGNYDVE